MKKTQLMFAALAAFAIIGCSTVSKILAPEPDPLVVSVENTQTNALAKFDNFLTYIHDNTNADISLKIVSNEVRHYIGHDLTLLMNTKETYKGNRSATNAIALSAAQSKVLQDLSRLEEVYPPKN